MIHLFNKVYLRHEAEFDSFSKSILLLSEAKDHPLVNMLEIPKIEAPTFSYVMEKYYENNIEIFWEEMLNKNSRERFDIFADIPIINQLSIQFWKSLFVGAEAEHIYQIHKFYFSDLKLKSFLFDDFNRDQWNHYRQSHQHLKPEQFKTLFDSVPVSDVIAKRSKEGVSFEFLLANYYANPETKYKEALFERVKTLAWKIIVHDIQDLKSELLNGFYNIKKIIPSAEIDANKIDQIEETVFRTAELRWMLDEKLKWEESQYIRAAYGKDLFLGFLRKLGFPEDSDFFKRFELVFDEKYEEYLNHNIQSGFGSLFTGDSMRQKCNQLLTGYIYDCVKNKKTDHLKGFTLN